MKQGIDVTKIDNFENAEAETLREFIKGFTFEDNAEEMKRLNAEVLRLKDSITSLSAENADVKRKYKETLSAEQQAALEREEADRKKDELIASLQREKNFADYKGKYADIGYSAELAERAANAILDGKTDDLFAVQKEFMEAHDKQIKIDNMKGTPQPPAGSGGEKNPDEMNYDELVTYLAAHPAQT